MQSHEERADEMLRLMGGALSLPMQQTVVRRLIMAEDAVVEYMALVKRLNENIKYLLDEQAQRRVEAERYRDEIGRLSDWALRAYTFIQASPCHCGSADECEAHTLIFEYQQPAVAKED